MSSRLPTSAFEPVASPRRSSRGTRASPRRSTRRRAGSRLVTDALIDASGVRRSCDTAASSAVRSSFASASPVGRGDVGAQPTALDRDLDLGRERAQHLAVLVRRAPARRPRAPRAAPSGTDERRRRPGRVGTGSPADRLDRPRPSSGSRSTATASAPNAARSCATSCGSGSSSLTSVPPSARQRLGLGPRAGRVGGAPAGDAHEPAHDPATTRNTSSASRFSPSAIVNVWTAA